MDRRRKANSDGKKSALPAVIAIALFVLSMLGELDSGIVAVLIMLIFLMLPVVIAVLVVKRVKAQQPTQHSHDRIDHSGDLKINPSTGRVERQPVQNTRHTPQEHWRQQLDGLLANGTIDRAEYRAMMNRKF